MNRIVFAVLGLLWLAVPVTAQQALTVGQVYADSIAPEQADTFTIELDADQFVAGEVDQVSADIVIVVLGPDGETVSNTDVTAEGPEHFQFDAEAAGRYRIEVRPFEEEDGAYTLTVTRVEPIATDPDARVDQLMAAYDGKVPGGVIGVVEDGELVFARAYGMADIAHDVPFEVGTLTNIGSTSKQFTAFAINLLVERGQVSLDDDVREYFPELPTFDDTVRVRHLLTHTSGYREFINQLALAGRRVDEGDYVGRFEVLEILGRQPELQNAPGAEFNYNNSAFSLLAQIVEKVTDTPFPEWMEQNVFGPLGMEHTLVRAHPGQIVPGGSEGYVPGDGSWREARDLGASIGAGGIYTTAGDLARWMANFATHELGSPEIWQRMTTPFVLVDGDTTGYGHGLFIDEYRGLQRVHHGGADMAHRSMLAYFPELNAGVIAESNNATFNSGAMASDVADVFFGDHMEPEEAEDGSGAMAEGESFDPASYDPADFGPFEGRYALDEAPQFVLTFSVESDTIYLQGTGQPRVPMEPTSDSTFKLNVVEASVTFHRNDEGAADSLTLHQNGDHLAHRLEAEPWEPTPEELEEYTGRWFSEELETFYHLAVEDSALVIRHRRYEEPLEMSPGEERDSFTGSFPVATAEFVRNDDGELVAMLVGNGRTRDIRFVRVELDL